MSEYSTTPKVIFEKDRRVGIITLTNGEMNVFDVEQVQGFRDLIVKLGSDDKIRALVIKGSGNRAFSSGFDLKNLDADLFTKDGQDMIYQLYNLPKPTIALVHGYCIGIAFLVALACDFRYATEDAQFSLPEINYEFMFPTHGGCTLLPKIARKMSDVKYILYTGDRFPAARAEKMGVVDQLFKTKEEMQPAGLEFAQKLSSKNPNIMAMCKVALKKTEFADLKTGMAIEIETIPILNPPQKISKVEQAEAVRKYIEKYSEKRSI
jgi:enoyl-CoA hydratase